MRGTNRCSEEVRLKALQQLARVELPQEVGGALDIRRLPILESGGVALHLSLWGEGEPG